MSLSPMVLASLAVAERSPSRYILSRGHGTKQHERFHKEEKKCSVCLAIFKAADTQQYRACAIRPDTVPSIMNFELQLIYTDKMLNQHRSCTYGKERKFGVP
jgi:hypothetical protein